MSVCICMCVCIYTQDDHFLNSILCICLCVYTCVYVCIHKMTISSTVYYMYTQDDHFLNSILCVYARVTPQMTPLQFSARCRVKYGHFSSQHGAGSKCKSLQYSARLGGQNIVTSVLSTVLHSGPAPCFQVHCNTIERPVPLGKADEPGKHGIK